MVDGSPIATVAKWAKNKGRRRRISAPWKRAKLMKIVLDILQDWGSYFQNVTLLPFLVHTHTYITDREYWER